VRIWNNMIHFYLQISTKNTEQNNNPTHMNSQARSPQSCSTRWTSIINTCQFTDNGTMPNLPVKLNWLSFSLWCCIHEYIHCLGGPCQWAPQPLPYSPQTEGLSRPGGLSEHIYGSTREALVRHRDWLEPFRTTEMSLKHVELQY